MDMSMIGWTRSYEEANRAALAATGDRADRFIDPLIRKEIRKARRKSRRMPSAYRVGCDGIRTRSFKKLSGASRYYHTLKEEGRKPWITNMVLGVSVLSSNIERSGASVKRANRDMFSPAKLLPAIQARVQRVTEAEVLQGPVIEGEIRSSTDLVPYSGQSSYRKKRLEFLKELPVVRDFLNMPADVSQTIMGLGGFTVAVLWAWVKMTS